MTKHIKFEFPNKNVFIFYYERLLESFSMYLTFELLTQFVLVKFVIKKTIN